MTYKKALTYIEILLAGVICRFFLAPGLDSKNVSLAWILIVLVLAIGTILIQRTGKLVKDSTKALTLGGSAGSGFLQKIGRSFPIMLIGIVAAFKSLEAVSTNYAQAKSLGLIAASSLFGSFIFIAFCTAGCVIFQNISMSNTKKSQLLNFLPEKLANKFKHLKPQKIKVDYKEIDHAISTVTLFLSLMAVTVLVMLICGKVTNLYQINRAVGILVLLVSGLILYTFKEKFNFQVEFSLWAIIELIFATIIAIFAAESLIGAASTLSRVTGIPITLVGALAGLIGCYEELANLYNTVLHQTKSLPNVITATSFSAVVITTFAALFSIFGGIFLGNDGLVVIFILIIMGNAILIQQLSTLKNAYLDTLKR